MARAGYDPREMAAMFRTMQSGGPEWLSDHPNPGNRFCLHYPGSAHAARRAASVRW